MRNEMMHRPVVKEELLDFMRTQQKKLPGELGKLEEEAHVAEVPVIPHETVVFLKFLLGQLQPERILEIGAAIGFHQVSWPRQSEKTLMLRQLIVSMS